jgi:hypothetical protein
MVPRALCARNDHPGFERKTFGKESDMSSYLPNSDPAFLTWAANFSSYITVNKSNLPLTDAQVTAVSSELATFNTFYGRHTTAQDAAKSACSTKDDNRDTVENTIRGIVRQLQASPDVTEAQKRAMGITVRGNRMSAMTVTTVSRPVGTVDTSKRFIHAIRYRDEASAGKARPAYAIGCEVWMATTAAGAPAPTDPALFNCLGLNSASPFVNEFTGTDGGKTAHYLLRWVSRDGTVGPWSETLSATVVG